MLFLMAAMPEKKSDTENILRKIFPFRIIKERRRTETQGNVVLMLLP